MVCNGAFCGCKSLTAVELPESIEEIGIDAFRKSGLESVKTPRSVRIIRQGAFCKCPNLQKVVLNEGLQALGTDEYFEGSGMYFGVFQESAVKHVDLPQTLKRIEYNTFKKCKSLKSIKLPDGLETIGLYAFSKSGLENIATPPSVRTVSQGAFFDCKSLTKAVLGEGLEMLGTSKYPEKGDLLHGVFERSGLSTIKLPSTLKSIEYSAFRNCAGLRKVKLPARLERIGEFCFSASGLEELTLPTGTRDVCAGVFCDCEQLQSVQLNEGLERLGVKNVANGNKYEGLVFAHSAIESITLPSTLRDIGQNTFGQCEQLKIIWVEENCAVNVRSGVDNSVAIVSTSQKTVGNKFLPDLRQLKDLTIPKGVQEIGEQWFKSTGIEMVTIPSSVTVIGKEAFTNC